MRSTKMTLLLRQTNADVIKNLVAKSSFFTIAMGQICETSKIKAKYIKRNVTSKMHDII